MHIQYKTVLKVAVPLIAALISIFIVSKYAASPEFHAATIEALDEKKTTVMELTAASTAASAAITLLPGDAATPIAEKLIDLSSCFLVVICAIYLEKYLVTITGYAAFTVLIPLACVLLAANVFVKSRACRSAALKLIAFGCAIVLVIPVSVAVSNLIERTYDSSIQSTIESAKEATEQIEAGAESSEKEDGGVLSGIISGISGVKDSIADAAANAENVLNNFMEALAVLLVTSCVIPILVLAFFVWITKLILGINLDLPRRKL